MDPLAVTGADPLTDLLNAVRTTGAVFHRSALSGAWAVRFQDGSPLALAAPLTGRAWVIPHRGEAVRLESGDVAVLCGGAPYVIADDPATEPDAVVRPGGRRTTPDGREAGVDRGADAPGGTLLLNGLYTVDGPVPGRLLAALPPLAVIGSDLGSCPVSPTVLEEITLTRPGQQVLLDRALDLMLITALRAWFTRPGAHVPAWYRAHSDPVVGPALKLLHARPAHPWTVAALAAETGVSRAALARRFTALVGQPPMTYLREQRLALAADLLRRPDTTIGAVASRVGFAHAFALSVAFKRHHGVSPSEYRTGTART